MLSYILDSLTLVVSLVVLTFNIVFSRRENTRRFLLDNVIHQRNADMLELRKLTAQFSALTDYQIVSRRIREEEFLNEVTLCSKTINHLLKRQYREDQQVLIIKERLLTEVLNYYDNKNEALLDEIKTLNLLFGKISELYVFCAWQCIKIQGTGEKRLGSNDFKKMFDEYKGNYLDTEDMKVIESLMSIYK